MPLPSIFTRVSNLAKSFLSEEKEQTFQRKEASEKVLYILNKYERFKDHFQTDRERENDDHRMYHGMDYGQWDSKQRAKLEDEGRHIGQYNFLKKKVLTLASILLRNWLDVDYVPVDGKYSTLTAILKSLYLSDKETMDWEYSYRLFLIDFLIFGATEELVIDKRYSPLGNVGWERIIPGHILFHPDWFDEFSWSLPEAMKIKYMNAEQISQKYSIPLEEIKIEEEILKKYGPYFDSTDFDAANLPYNDLNETYGTTYKVIEDHYLKKEKKKVEYVFDVNGQLTEIPSHYTDEEKRQWVIFNDIDIQMGVIEKDIEYDKYMICTVCPYLFGYKPLQEKEALLQIGRLPFVHRSVGRVNGKDCGIIHDLKDIQVTINKRESLVEHIIANSANGGKFIDPEIVANDYTKLEEIRSNWNSPTFTEFSAPGEIASGRKHVEELPRAQFPSDSVNELNRMWELSDRLPITNPASDGRSEGSEDRSAILYARKAQQGEINTTMITKCLEGLWNEKGEMYALVAPALYGGVYREFRMPGTNKTFSINEEIDTPYGKVTINNIADLPRHKVVISQSPQGVTYREIQRSLNAELIRNIPGQNPISRAIAVSNVMKSLDMTTEERKEYEIASELEKQLAFESIKAQINGFKLQSAKMELILQNPQLLMQPQNEEGTVEESQGAEEVPQVLPT